jgi:DNA-directed RNA polymerase
MLIPVYSSSSRSFVGSMSRFARLSLLLLFFTAFSVSAAFSRQLQANGNSNRAYRKASKKAQKQMRNYAKQQRKAMKKSSKAQRKAMKRAQRNNTHY